MYIQKYLNCLTLVATALLASCTTVDDVSRSSYADDVVGHTYCTKEVLFIVEWHESATNYPEFYTYTLEYLDKDLFSEPLEYIAYFNKKYHSPEDEHVNMTLVGLVLPNTKISFDKYFFVKSLFNFRDHLKVTIEDQNFSHLHIDATSLRKTLSRPVVLDEAIVGKCKES